MTTEEYAATVKVKLFKTVAVCIAVCVATYFLIAASFMLFMTYVFE